MPIIDLRIKFNLGAPTYDPFTVVIILNISDRVLGMVVDSVSDVITLKPEQIRPAPSMGSMLDTEYLIDLDRLMSSDEMGQIEKTLA